MEPELQKISAEDPRATASPWYRPDMTTPPPGNTGRLFVLLLNIGRNIFMSQAVKAPNP